MSVLSRVALVTAAAMSTIALYDAAHMGFTGRPSGFSDQFGLTPMMVIGGLTHGLGYAALVAVLAAAGPRIDAGSAVRRWIRRLLQVDLTLLAVMFLVGTPFVPALERAGWGGVTSAFGGIAFLLMFVLAVALGLASVRRPEGRPAALVLVATVPLLGLTVGLGALDSGFAHPAYPEATVYLGLALLAHQLAPVRARTAASPTLASASAG
jgi:hypothetical protein